MLQIEDLDLSKWYIDNEQLVRDEDARIKAYGFDSDSDDIDYYDSGDKPPQGDGAPSFADPASSGGTNANDPNVANKDPDDVPGNSTAGYTYDDYVPDIPRVRSGGTLFFGILGCIMVAYSIYFAMKVSVVIAAIGILISIVSFVLAGMFYVQRKTNKFIEVLRESGLTQYLYYNVYLCEAVYRKYPHSGIKKYLRGINSDFMRR